MDDTADYNDYMDDGVPSYIAKTEVINTLTGLYAETTPSLELLTAWTVYELSLLEESIITDSSFDVLVEYNKMFDEVKGTEVAARAAKDRSEVAANAIFKVLMADGESISYK